MKSLKIVLIATYIILIVLLLLGLIKCESSPKENPPIQETFKADVVLCIDCTGSMENIISTVKNNALNFYADMKDKCLTYGKEVSSMRIKVLAFRDTSDTPAYEQSTFFKIPLQADSFKSFVSNLEADGGGDTPEMAYDALGLAMNSEWLSEADVRKVIILWTDAPSHPLSPTIPGPTSFEQLTTYWQTQMNTQNKRLILFAPNDVTWTTITDTWDQAFRHDVSLGAGLSDIDYEKIIKVLSESI